MKPWRSTPVDRAFAFSKRSLVDAVVFRRNTHSPQRLDLKDTPISMLPGVFPEAQGAFKVLMTHVLHFAAFFIAAGSKTSVAESFSRYV